LCGIPCPTTINNLSCCTTTTTSYTGTGLDLCGIPRLCSVKPTNLQLQFILPTGSFSKPYNTNLEFTLPTGLVLCGIPCPSVVNPTLHPTNLQFTSHTGLDLCCMIPYLKL
jgi:hypothetical protein